MRLLIIEDNMELCDSMKIGLEKAGFQVDTAYAGLEGEEKAYAGSYDAVLLDLNLPDRDGLEILRFLRESDVAVPVLIITARDEIKERALGLDLGADDYITKPFQLLELRARIQAVVRRFHGRTNPRLCVGALTVNPASRTVEYNGTPVVLAAKEFDILEYLAMRHPAVVSMEEIAEHIYDERLDPSSSVLRVHLTMLRKELTQASGKPLLQNIRGKGYQLCVELI
ncbi:response regulator transcription factor [Clostridium sp. D33t1_170424_F3]|uniref:response regulator transcription factor n=1 Tax=Clostridium sp. D33t1_170424_F3 TaxID=2787099 RepID=UPI0018AAFBF9|nr:response regulator transcription factor [Clostridium sp. D33t1_170424_F3]